MSELALELIRENKRTKDTFLDLGNCGLTELPHELFDCTWLKGLILGDYYYTYHGLYMNSKNLSEKNKILDSELERLLCFTSLELLSLESNDIEDANIIGALTNLKYLSLGFNNINHFDFLEKLTELRTLSN